MAIVYDLTAGSLVDWTTLLPTSLTGKVALAAGADGTKMVTLASKRLHALYLESYRPKTGDAKIDEADKECRDAVTNLAGGAPPMMACLDAKVGGLAVQFDLPDVVQACADAGLSQSQRCGRKALRISGPTRFKPRTSSRRHPDLRSRAGDLQFIEQI